MENFQTRILWKGFMWFHEFFVMNILINLTFCFFNILGSAVCSFDLKTIEDTFKGPFKKQNNRDSIWQAVDDDVDHSHFECQRSTDRDYRTPNSREYQLLNQAVPSTPQGPVYKVSLTPLLRSSWYTYIHTNF